MPKKKSGEKKKKADNDNSEEYMEQYKILFESSTDAIMTLGRDRFTDCNEATLKMFGMTKEEFTAVHPSEISPPKQANGKDSRSEADKRIATAFKNGYNKFEWIHRRSNGEDFPATVWLTAFPLDGKQVLQATVRDITEQKGIELALSESEERLRSIWDSVQTGILIIDSETREIIDINNKALNMIGTSRKKVIGKICHKFICPSEVGNCPILDLGQEEDSMESVLITAKGKEIPIQKSVATFKRGDRKYILDSFVDISQQKKAEAQLEEYKEHLEELVEERSGQLVKAEKEVRRLIQAVETSVNPMAILDIDMNIVYANIAFGELFEANMNELLKSNTWEYIEKDYLDLVRENIEMGMEGKDIDIFEIQARTAKGNLRWVEVVGSLVYDDGGEPEGIMVIIKDTTERKKIMETLIATEDKYRLLVERANDGILIIQDGKVEYMNPALLKLSGYTMEEQLGRDYIENVAPEARERVGELFKARMRGEPVPAMYETILLKKDGTKIPVEVNATVMDYHGKPANFVYLRDLEERKKAEEIIKESEEKYRKLIETANDSIFLADIESGIIIDTNKRAEKLIGRSRKEIIGMKQTKLHPKGMAEKYRRIFERHIKKGTAIEGDVYAMHKSGKKIPISISASTFMLGGKPVIQGIFHDLTERKKIEVALQKEKELSETIIQTADAIIVGLDKNHRIQLFNQGAERITGYSSKEAIGKDWFKLVFKSEMLKEMNKVWKDAGGKSVHSYVNPIWTKSGEKRIVAWSNSSIEGEDEKIKMVISFGHDITDREKAKEDVKASEERFRQIAINALEWIWEVDANGLYTYSSPVIENILGYKTEEVIGKKHFYDMFHPEEQESLKKAAFEAFANKQPFREFLNRNIHKNGKEVWLSTSGVPIIDDEGNLLGYRGADTDITERKLAEGEIIKFKELSENTINNSPVGIVTTDLNGNILTANPALLEMLGSPSEEKTKEFNVLTLKPMMKQGLSKLFAECLKKGKKIKVESMEYISFWEKNIMVCINIVPLRDADGNQIGMLALIEDITEQSLAKEALVVSERIYRGLYESTIALADSTDLGEVISVIAEQAKIMLNGECSTIYLWDEFEKKLVPYYTNAEGDRDKFMEHKLKLGEGLTGTVAKKKKGAFSNYDDKKKVKGYLPGTKSDRDHVQSIIAEPMMVEGQLVGIINVIAEDRKFAEEDLLKIEILANQASIAYMRSQSIDALTQSEGRFRRMAENIHDGMTIIENGKVVYINDRACEIYGYPKEELMNMTLLDTVIPEDRDQMHQIIENAGKTGVILGELEFWIEQKNGERHYVRTRTSTSKEAKNVSEFIITTDITSRKLAEEEAKRKKMKFLLEEGRTYLVKEFRPELSMEAFNDLIGIDYTGIIISRTPKKDIQKSIIGQFEHIWLGQKSEKEEQFFDDLISIIGQIHGKSAVLIDRLDYLIFKYGFRETLSFLYNLRDTVYLKEQIVILSIDPSTISEEELNLIQKEMSEIEKRQVPRPSEEQFEIIEKIYEKNSSGIKPSFSEIGSELGVSKPTFRKRVRSLISNGYVVELTKGNKKVLELTQKGRSLFFK